MLTNGTEIAVKKLYDLRGLDDVQFSNEFSNLMRVQHKNIVRFIGYCNEARHELMEVNGEDVLCKMIYKVLCFEYLPRGSLENYLHGEYGGNLRTLSNYLTCKQKKVILTFQEYFLPL